MTVDHVAWEHRTERAYDEQDPSHLLCPNGSLVASFDRAFLAAAGREVLALHRAAMSATDERTPMPRSRSAAAVEEPPECDAEADAVEAEGGTVTPIDGTTRAAGE